LLAPAIGLNAASYFLKFYVAPNLHPTIKNNDPRWIGQWWAGYIIFSGLSFLFVPIMAAFPKVLPRAALRKKEENEIKSLIDEQKAKISELDNVEKASVKDLFITIKRLLMNKVYFCNTMAAVFYVFGYIPYGYFMNKYLQIQYLLTPSFANSMIGSVAFVASAIGLLSAGVVITIFKPRARYLAGWNIVTSLISAIGLMSYAFLGCSENNNALILRK
jgi:MFS family permease